MSKHNRDRRKRGLPNYAEAVFTAARDANLKPGHYYEIPIRHEGHCRLLKGDGPCNCNPEIRPPERIPPPEEN